MYEEFFGDFAIYFLIFLIVIVCKYIINLILKDDPEIEMEDERKNYECGKEQRRNMQRQHSIVVHYGVISDDPIECPNITKSKTCPNITMDKPQQTFQIV
jgi:hypothetical protein